MGVRVWWALWAGLAVAAGGCSYDVRALEEPEYFKDGDYDDINGAGDGRFRGDGGPGCEKGYTGPNCDACAIGHVRYEGDRCVPRCAGGTNNCSNHGDCVELEGGDQLCLCDEGYDDADCGGCAPDWVPDGEACVEGCNLISVSCVYGSCQDDQTPVGCACWPNSVGADCGECLPDHVALADLEICAPTCESAGWQNCGFEAFCDLNIANGDVTCHCENGYQDADGDGLCEPNCGAGVFDCFSFVDGDVRGTCQEDISAGVEPYCLCYDGFQDLDLNGTCEPACVDDAGVTLCNGGSCATDGPFGEAVCTCDPAQQDFDGDGWCGGLCGACSPVTAVGHSGCRYVDGSPSCRKVLYVRAGANPGGDGASWLTAVATIAEIGPVLADGAFSFTTGYEIWFAEGSYDVTSAGLVIPNDVHVYGGFPNDAMGNVKFEDRDPDQHPTAIDGGDPVTGPAHLVRVIGDRVHIDGLIFRNGAAITQTNDDHHGGALIARAAEGAQNLEVFNCTFDSNRALDGGAVYLQNVGSTVFRNVTFHNNTVDDATNTFAKGGAIRIYGGSLFLLESRMIDNRATGTSAAGGGIYADGGANVIIKSSLLTSNKATAGSAIYLASANGAFDRVRFVANGFGGGTVVGYDAGTDFSNVLFLSNGNATNGNSGALRLGGSGSGSDMPIANATFFDNRALAFVASGISIDNVDVTARNIILWTHNIVPQVEVSGSGSLAVWYGIIKDSATPCTDCDLNFVTQASPAFVVSSGVSTGHVKNPAKPWVHYITLVTNPYGANELAGMYIIPDVLGSGARYLPIIGNDDQGIYFFADSDYETTNPTGGTDYDIISLWPTVSSPAVDAGTSDNAPGRDIEGYPRFDALGVANQGAGTPDFTDIGCYEHQGM